MLHRVMAAPEDTESHQASMWKASPHIIDTIHSSGQRESHGGQVLQGCGRDVSDTTRKNIKVTRQNLYGGIILSDRKSETVI